MNRREYTMRPCGCGPVEQCNECWDKPWPKPELLAVIRSDAKEVVVVKRGAPVHVSEVIPDVVGHACPVCGSRPVVVGVPVHGPGDHGWLAECRRGDHAISLSATTRDRAIARWNAVASREASAA